MKEATGELNMTVITVVAIVAVGGLFTLFVWPAIRRSIRLNSACSSAGNTEYKTTENDGAVIECNTSGLKGKCRLTEKGGKTHEKQCDTNNTGNQNN